MIFIKTPKRIQIIVSIALLALLPLATYGSWEAKFKYLGVENGSGLSIEGVGSGSSSYMIRPGKEYIINHSGSWTRFFPPEGYTLYIEGEKTRRISGSLNDATLIIVKNGPSASRHFGDLLEVDSYPKSWRISLGSLVNGLGAGFLEFREIDNVDPIEMLSCPSYKAGVEILKDQLVLRQVKTDQMLLDIEERDEDEIYIRFYLDENVGSKSGGFYRINGPHLIEYELLWDHDTEYTLRRTEGSRTQEWVIGVGGSWGHDLLYPGSLKLYDQDGSDSGSYRDFDVRIKRGTGEVDMEYHEVNKVNDFGSFLTEVEFDLGAQEYTKQINYYGEGYYKSSQYHLGSVGRPSVIFDFYGRRTDYEYYDEHDSRGGRIRQIDSEFDSQDKTRNEYFDYQDDWNESGDLLSSYTSSYPVYSEESSRSHTYSGYANGEPLNHISRSDFGGTDYEQRDIEYYRAHLWDTVYVDLPYSAKGPDGRKASYLYQVGNYNDSTKVFYEDSNGDYWREISFHGWENGIGTLPKTRYDEYDDEDVSQLWLVEKKSFKEVIIRNKKGHLLRSEMHIYVDDSNDVPLFELVSWTEIDRDAKGDVTRIEKSTGEILEWEYTDGLMTAHIDSTGQRREFQYDALERVTKETVKGAPAYGAYPAQPDIVTDYAYNALDQIISKSVSSGGQSQTWSWTFDKMGRIASETAPGNLTTSYSYTNEGGPGGFTKTVTYPNGGSVTTEYYEDQRVKEVTGNATVPQYKSYLNERVTTNIGTPGSPRNNTIGFDSLYRPENMWDTASIDYENVFDEFGRLTAKKAETPSFNTLKYEYNAYGELFREGEQRWHDFEDPLDAAGDYHLTEYDHRFEKISSDWWQVKETKLYAEQSSSSTITSSIVKTKLGGCSCGPEAEVRAIDIHGNTTTTTITSDRTNKIRRKIVDSPASSINAEEIYHNGKLVETISHAGHSTYFEYDGLGRQIEVIHPRKGSYKTFYDSSGFVDYEEDPQGRQTSYTYDTAGRVSSVTNPDGKVTNYQYNARNQVTQVSGDTINTRTYSYNTYGELTGITGSSNITWQRNETTGLLESKTIDGKTTTFTYNSARKLNSETGPRGITTSYEYHNSNTPLLTSLSYSDSTPSVSIGRDRTGRTISASDSSGSRVLSIDSSTRQILSEPIPYVSNLQITPTYATSGSVIGRGTGFELGTSNNTDLYHETAYGYDGFGRLDAITGSINGSGNRAFDYGYLANSNLVDRLDQLSSGFARLHSYEPNRDLLASVDNMISSTTVAGFDYRYDSLGRRTDVVKTGTLYDIYGGSGLVDKYTYSSKNELLSANTYVGSDPDATLPALPGRSFSFNYDTSDNLSSKVANGVTSTFGLVSGNFVSSVSKSNYNVIDVSGADDAAATVTANGVSASRQDEYFYAAADISGESSNLPYPQITVSSTLGGSTTNESFRVFEKGSSYGRNQDNDGNPTDDYRWTYVYDAENRVIEMTEKSFSANPDPRKRLHYDYDYMGRRWQKEVYEYVSSTWTLVSRTKYVYATSSFNLIAELDGLNNDAVIRTYTWGKDLSGTLSGAGGVGGLLMLSEAGTDYLASYDGNGNLVALTNATDGSLAAAYEYSPYGRLLRAEGPMAKKNPFRFSTKYTDDETGLVYYGFRYYNPSLGRFINRDPVEEQGGLNLYAAFANDPINHIDVLGMYCSDPVYGLCEELYDDGVAQTPYWNWGGVYDNGYKPGAPIPLDPNDPYSKVWWPDDDGDDGPLPIMSNIDQYLLGQLVDQTTPDYSSGADSSGNGSGGSDPTPMVATPVSSPSNGVSDFSMGGPTLLRNNNHRVDNLNRWNGLGNSDTHFTSHSIKINLSTDTADEAAQEAYRAISEFRFFNGEDRLANASVSPDGKFVFFKPTNPGKAAGLPLSGFEKSSPVGISRNDDTMTVTGETQEGHFLVGRRGWRVEVNSPSQFTITTRGYEQILPQATALESSFKIDQMQIWEDYLYDTVEGLGHSFGIEFPGVDSHHATILPPSNVPFPFE